MNSAPFSNQASFCFDIHGTAFEFGVVSFEAVEAISAPFQVNVTLGCQDPVDFKELAGKEAVLTVASADTIGSNRYFHGEITKFKQIGDNGDYYLYRARLVPAIWKLSLEQDCRIFQNSSLQSIIETIFHESGITSDRYKFLLKDKELKSQYCVQYNETDLNFISRLLEEEGIFYFFEHYEDKHIIVFCDFARFCNGISGDTVIPYHSPDGLVPGGESITAFNFSERLYPNACTTTSFNYKRTSIDLTSETGSSADSKTEIYEYSGTFASQQRGKKLAKIRMEEHSSLGKKAKGESNCPRLISGFTFTLKETGPSNLHGDYLLLGVEHVGDQPQSLESQGGGSSDYWNGFICIPSSVNLRPSRITPKPVIPGMQTAIVTGPSGEQIYHDNFGRVKVRFHWDRKGAHDEKSSCWLRYAQGWGGGGWGMQFIPRVGDEVLVAFLDGDPDRPVIVGSLYNSANMPLYNPFESKAVSSIKTRSYPNGGMDNFNELRFDDNKGNEEIYLQGERDLNILVKNDRTQQVIHNESHHVGNNRLQTVQVDQVEQVGRNDTETIGANKTISVGGNKTETVAINSAETVGVAKELTVGGLYQVSVAGAMNETVIGAKAEEVGLTKQVMVGSHMTERVAGNRSIHVGEDLSATIGQTLTQRAKVIILEADEEIVLKAGAATISLKANGEIVVKGTSCTQTASGEFIIKGARTSVN
jgi:type VI secretion system secreted protein VgrG